MGFSDLLIVNVSTDIPCRSVQAVIELKNKPTMWHRAKKVSLTAGQTDIKIEFPLPITACNLMIEYADFYENIQASSETLQVCANLFKIRDWVTEVVKRWSLGCVILCPCFLWPRQQFHAT